MGAVVTPVPPSSIESGPTRSRVVLLMVMFRMVPPLMTGLSRINPSKYSMRPMLEIVLNICVTFPWLVLESAAKSVVYLLSKSAIRPSRLVSLRGSSIVRSTTRSTTGLLMIVVGDTVGIGSVRMFGSGVSALWLSGEESSCTFDPV